MMHRILFILDLWGTPNYYQGIDIPTFWEWFYKWRVSLKTAIEIDKIFNDK